MSAIFVCAGASRATRLERLMSDGASGLAGGLRFAAAPAFAVMALLSGFDGGGASRWLCSAAPEASPLGGMALMYGLMALVHAPPWLKALSRRRQNEDAWPPPT
jgi:hypothetical protein